MPELDRKEILEALKRLKGHPPISSEEYWERVNKLSKEEQIAFEEETKKLRMSWLDFHKPFTL